MNLNNVATKRVTKRDGRVVVFDESKIEQAILKAFHDVDACVTLTAAQTAKEIAQAVAAKTPDEVSVEEIQDMVEVCLMEGDRKDVAKAYIIYRNNRTVARMADTELMRSVRDKTGALNVENSNANVDERSFSGREKEASAAVQKALAFDFGGMSEEASKAHKEMLVYQHDADKIVVGETNCLFVDFEHLFKEGFSTRNGTVRPPTSFSTACQLVAVVFQCQSQNQFGGVASIHLDYDLAPFVKMSFYRHYADGLKYLERCTDKDCAEYKALCAKYDWSIDDGRFRVSPRVYEYAMDMLEREGQQAAQGLYHNLNTLESRQGQQVDRVAWWRW